MTSFHYSQSCLTKELVKISSRQWRCWDSQHVKKQVKEPYNAKSIQQSGLSGCKKGHKSLFTVLFDKSHLRECVVSHFQMLKKYYLFTVLIALGLWLLSTDTISEFALTGIVPRNQAERDFVTKSIYFSNESHLHELQMIKWHTVAILLFRVCQELFFWCYEDETVFISTCEIYSFPFTSISCSFISPGKEHVSLKQTKYLICGWLQIHCRHLQKSSLWQTPVWMWWKLRVSWIPAALHLGDSAVVFNWPAWFSMFWFLSCFFLCPPYHQ